jgi:hypothetical protein
MTSNKPKLSLRDQLTATTTDESKIELTEQELRRIAGGPKPMEYFYLRLPQIYVSPN